MKLRLIDRPKSVTSETYNDEINEMISFLSDIEGLSSIYQIGSVSSPGISDIDLFVVFDDQISVDIDPVKSAEVDDYLFTHQLYGCSIRYWNDLRKYTFFHNYTLRYGEELGNPENKVSVEDQQKLKKQIALEFLIKMYLVLKVQVEYGIIKTRSFLLEGKALIYDLKFLRVESGKVFELVQEIISLRTKWFEKPVGDDHLQKVVIELYNSLNHFIEERLNKHHFFLPDQASLQISRNMSIEFSVRFKVERKGITLPYLGILPERKFFNLLHRINYFTLFLPYKIRGVSNTNRKRFKLLKEMKKYNEEYLPEFLIPASSLSVI